MSDEKSGDEPGGRAARLSPDTSAARRKWVEERLRNRPIVQLRLSIFSEDTGRPTDIEWHVSSWPMGVPANTTPDGEAGLLNRVRQEIQGVRQRLEADAFPGQLLDRIVRELEAIPQRLQEQGFPGRHGGWYKCSFCGKKHDQVHRLIAGPGGVYICDECINLCREIIEEEARLADSPPSGAPGAGSED